MSDRGALIIGGAIVIAAVIVVFSHRYVPVTGVVAVVDSATGNYKLLKPGISEEK